MRYKIYPVIFVLALLGFMSIFGGIVDVEYSSGCSETHTRVGLGELEITSNGNQAIVKQVVSLWCKEGYKNSCDECKQRDYSISHYNDSVSVSVLQGGSIVQTVPSEIEEDDSVYVIKNNFTFVSIGDYILRYTIVCSGGITSTKDQPITITEGINGFFDLTGLAITCNETGNRFNFDPSHFTGTNAISIENTDFSLKLDMAAEIDSVLYPCIGNSYELDESGTFTSDGNQITISYVDGSATVSQAFTYSYDGDNLVLNYSEDNEDSITMSFKKSTLLAKR